MLLHIREMMLLGDYRVNPSFPFSHQIPLIFRIFPDLQPFKLLFSLNFDLIFRKRSVVPGRSIVVSDFTLPHEPVLWKLKQKWIE